MAEYKLYILKDNDKVIDVVQVDCVSDAEALNLLEGGAHRHAIEIWQGDRFLARARRTANRSWLGAASMRPQLRVGPSSVADMRPTSSPPCR